jgi:hypothetical protein
MFASSIFHLAIANNQRSTHTNYLIKLLKSVSPYVSSDKEAKFYLPLFFVSTTNFISLKICLFVDDHPDHFAA